jgi:benzoyl-CoA-dihydrodiol lyase
MSMGEHTKETRIASFETHPSRYKHWKLAVDGSVATLTMAIKEENGLRDDYLLKLNSYDMGVDIELHDVVERLRFEHPEVRAVQITSGIPRIFCAGANIRMLATSTHGFKVNFCKFTNETRLNIEESSRNGGLTWVAALNGTASGGGYELALACDEIYLIDDGNSAASLPEVPLLGVLPGTGGLTRLVDKRKVRRDIADLFCTKAEGFRARDAVKTRIVDGAFPRSKWDQGIADALKKAAAKHPARSTKGVELPPLEVTVSEDGLARTYRYVTLSIDPGTRVATLTVKAPNLAAPAGTAPWGAAPKDYADLLEQGARTWSYQAFKEMDDALLHLRFNHDTVGLVLLRTEGDAAAVLAHDEALQKLQGQWFADEVRLYQARALRRLDNMSRSMFAIIDQGSCFAGSLFEIALSADRSYMLQDDAGANKIRVTAASGGLYPMTHGPSRLQARFLGEPGKVEEVLAIGQSLDAEGAFEIGLVTAAPDAIDWEDEVRIAIEERASISPDALTGMEQNLRFVGHETCDLKIFGRLTAWQNWIFQRPNAVGESGALTLYGHPERPRFDWRRT